MLLLSPTSYSLAYLYKPTGDRCTGTGHPCLITILPQVTISHRTQRSSDMLTPNALHLYLHAPGTRRCFAHTATACWIFFAGFVLSGFIYSLLAILAYSLSTSVQNILTAYYLLITRLLPFNYSRNTPDTMLTTTLLTNYALTARLPTPAILQTPCLPPHILVRIFPSLSRVSPTSPLNIAPVRPLAYHLSLPPANSQIKSFL